MVTSKNELYVFLDTLEARYENICSSIERAEKNNFLENQPSNNDSIWREAAQIFLDTSINNTITEWHERSGSLADKELKRRLELWYRTCLGGKIFFNPEIYRIRNYILKQYYANLKREQNLQQPFLTVSLQKVKNLIRRKAIYERMHQLHSDLIPDYIQLVKLCNEKAKEAGFPNYYSFLLYLDAIDEVWLLETIENLENHSRDAYLTLLDQAREKFRIDTPAPWNLDPVYGIQPDLIHKHFPAESLSANLVRFMDSIGTSFDSLNIIITAKRNHTGNRSFRIFIPDSIEVVLEARGGLEAFREGLSMIGEAYHAASIDVQYPILKGYSLIPGSSSVSFNEGAARAFRYFMDDSLRLTAFHGIGPKEVDRYLTQRSITDLYNLRKLICDFYNEYRLFQDPDQDIDSLAKNTYMKYVADTSAGVLPISFALSREYLTVSGDTYKRILREIISAQLYEALMNKFGAESTYIPKIASWLIRTLYSDGELREWQKRIIDATGKSVEPGALLRKLGVEHTKIITHSGNTLP